MRHHNLAAPLLIEASVKRGEGILTRSGALSVTTGKYTGRSPKDRYIVDDPEIHGRIDWGPVNKPISREVFLRLKERVAAELRASGDTYVFEGFIGRDPRHRLPVKVETDLAWQNLFARDLLVRPGEAAADGPRPGGEQPGLDILCASTAEADPAVDGTNSEAFVILDLTGRTIIIGSTRYAGEIKKSVFSFMNYLLPTSGIPSTHVLPMHCGANMGPDGGTALFFGLSGTGKTTLSADVERRLIGDDEHGWTDEGVFNLEGGCYAKCINLSRGKEPQIWEAIRFGSVVENVIVDPDARECDFADSSLTENTRAGYPLELIPDTVASGRGGHPTAVLFLTADAFGVLPPLAKLDISQAMYYFLSGYTSKLAGTERGITEPQATFSTCFAAPFLPLRPETYAELLGERLAKHGSDVYLVNTGWTGGPYGVGKRMDLPVTRTLVRAAISGALREVTFLPEPAFGLMVPGNCPGVPTEVLIPRNTWADKQAYDRTAAELAASFRKNFAGFAGVSQEVAAAGPQG